MSTPPNPRQAAGEPAGASHYQLLELTPGATAAELRQAFRRLSKRYHPDTTSLPSRQAEEAFRRLQLAYGVLSDPASRRRYDASLLGPAAMPQATPTSAASGAIPGPAGTSRPGEMPRALGVRRALSGGEWFALLLLALALVLSLVLGIGVAWARGAALVRSPSWWSELQAPPPGAVQSVPAVSPDPAADGVPAA